MLREKNEQKGRKREREREAIQNHKILVGNAPIVDTFPIVEYLVGPR